MEELVKLGKTTRSRSNFGRPILFDTDGRGYQLVEERYQKILDTVSSFDPETMRAFDFKLILGRGKRWQEPPSPHDVLEFYDPSTNPSIVCSGTVSIVYLETKRAYGLLYLEDFQWISLKPDFTT